MLPAAEHMHSGEFGPTAAATDDAWKAVLDRVVPCCVVLKGAAPVPRRSICRRSFACGLLQCLPAASIVASTCGRCFSARSSSRKAALTSLRGWLLRSYADAQFRHRGCRLVACDRLHCGRSAWDHTDQPPRGDARRALLPLALTLLGMTCGSRGHLSGLNGACAGPTTSEAVFLNHEELSVHVIYRDPVHDFAFLRCDLAALKVRDRPRLHRHS